MKSVPPRERMGRILTVTQALDHFADANGTDLIDTDR